MHNDEHNPYAPPEARDVEAFPTNDLARAEAIRREHIKHEASVKSVGCLHLFGGIFLLFGALIGLGAMLVGGARGGNLGAAGIGATILVVYLVLGAASTATGYGLRTLAPWAKVPGAILAGLGLLGFPIGTIINAYILWLLLSAKGTTVLSPEYKYVITATPHIKYIPWLAIIFLGLLVLLIGLGAASAVWRF